MLCYTHVTTGHVVSESEDNIQLTRLLNMCPELNVVVYVDL